MTYLILLNDGTWFEKPGRVGVPFDMRALALTKELLIGSEANHWANELVHAPWIKLTGIDRRAGLAIYREVKE